jgi:hypothetical protein
MTTNDEQFELVRHRAGSASIEAEHIRVQTLAGHGEFLDERLEASYAWREFVTVHRRQRRLRAT